MGTDNNPNVGVVLGDVDGDGNLDAVFANADLQRNRVCAGDGTGGFSCSDVSTDFNNSFGVAVAPAVSVGLDHFLCYKAKSARGTPRSASIPNVNLVDPFEDKLFDIRKVQTLCHPAHKNGGEINDDETHLRGYEIKLSRTRPRQRKHARQSHVKVDDTFGSLFVDTKEPERLLVPTAKTCPVRWHCSIR